MMLDFWVPGQPVGKPGLFVKRFGTPCPTCGRSPNAVVAPRQSKRKPDPHEEWRNRIVHAFALHMREAGIGRIDEPIWMSLDFRIGRPKSHYGTGRNSNSLKPSAPTHHLCKPDRDNLLKFWKDCVTDAGLWRDDCIDIAGRTTKAWAATRVGGVRVKIRSASCMKDR